MNTRRMINLCTAVAALIAGSSSVLADTPSAPVTRPAVNDPQSNEAVNPARPIRVFPATNLDWSPVTGNASTQPPSFSLRNVPTAGGSNSCQYGYRSDGNPPASRNAMTFNVVDNFRVLTSGQLTTVSFSGQYRAGSGNGGSPYRDATAAEITTIGPTESFTITIYNDQAGLPVVSPVVFTQTLTLTRTDDAVDTVTYLNGGNGNTTTTFKVRNYTANLTAGPSLVAGTCYWLEVRRATTGIPSTLVWRWYHSSASTGDGYSFQKTTGTAQFNAFAGVYGFDFAWCMNIATDTNPLNKCPAIPFPPACTYPNASGGASPANVNCQVAAQDPVNGGIIIVQSNTKNTVVSAEDFTTVGTQVLKGFCFAGFYTNSNPNNNECYYLRIWKNIPIVAGTSPYSFPDVNNLVAKINLVPSYSQSPPITGTPGTVISLPASYPGPTGGAVGAFEYVIDLSNYNSADPTMPFNNGSGGISLPAGCYWISLQEAGGGTNTFYYILKKYTSGANTGGINGDNYFVAKGTWTTDATAFTVLDQSYGYDPSFCLNFALNTNTGTLCPPVPLAANDTCAHAIDFDNYAGAPSGSINPVSTDPTVPHLFQNLNAGRSLDTGLTAGDIWIPGDENSYGTWFTVTGNGANIQISTCNSGTPTGGEPNRTNFDTTIYVYCASTCAGPFKFYDDNNDGSGTDCTSLQDANGASIGASKVNFPSVAGQKYYVFITGANTLAQNPDGIAGFYWVTKGAGTAAANNPAVICSQIHDPDCAVVVPAVLGANEQIESGSCPETTANSDPCDTVGIGAGTTVIDNLPLGNYVYGNQTNDGFSSNLDYYKLPDQMTDGVGYNIECYSEYPIVVGIVQLPCPFPTGDNVPTNAVQSVFDSSCYKGIVFQAYYAFSEANAPDQDAANHHYIFVRPPAAAGLVNVSGSCAGHSRYRLRVTIAPVGACCTATDPVCNLATKEFCTYDQSDDGGTVGIYIGDGTTCAAVPCDDQHTAPNGGGTSYEAFGSCCDPEGVCYVTTASACPNGNGQHFTQTFATHTAGANAPGFTSIGACVVVNATNGGKDCVTDFAVKGCCFPDGSCWVYDPAKCTSVGGTPQLGFCIPNHCPQPVATTTCCIAGVCSTNLTPTQCTGSPNFGVDKGFGVACTPDNPCDQTCCTLGACTITTQQLCDNAGGTVIPFGSCTPNPCKGVCCNGSACQPNTLQAACTGTNTVWSGATSLGTSAACNLVGPPADGGPKNPKTPCCKANFNHDASITTNDLFGFLAAWFAKTIQSDVNGATPGSGAANVTTNDLFDFLAAWFAKGCA